MSDLSVEKHAHNFGPREPYPMVLQGVYAAVQNLSDGLLTVDRENRITFMNPAAEAITGWSAADALGKPSGVVLHLVNALTREASWQPVAPAMSDNRPYTLLPNTLLIRKDLREIPIEDTTSPIHDEEGSVTGAVITFRDVGTARALLRQVLERVHRDSLTSLPDRTALEERFVGRRSSANAKTCLSMMYLDIDRFKQINDTLGHLAGDFVLQTLAQRLREAVPSTALVCRLGGDEFAILSEEVCTPKPMQGYVETILSSVREPILFSGRPIQITISLGVVIREEKRLELQDLLGWADAAMYRAKHSGGNRVEWDNLCAAEPHAVCAKPLVRGHFAANDITVHYQPIVNLQTGLIAGAEALLRCKKPDGSPALPLEVVSGAERSGNIALLGQAVLRQALRQQTSWRELGFTELTMNINVSVAELLDASYLQRLDMILEEENYTPGCVTLELTESVLLHSEQQDQLVRGLAERGLRIAIDDFGVGYSNLSYLRRFPVSLIKIDREFLQHVPAVEQDRNLVRAMIAMARSLGCNVVAEGVETEAQKLYLRELACPQAQGFLFSPPVAADHFLALLRQQQDHSGLGAFASTPLNVSAGHAAR